MTLISFPGAQAVRRPLAQASNLQPTTQAPQALAPQFSVHTPSAVPADRLTAALKSRSNIRPAAIQFAGDSAAKNHLLFIMPGQEAAYEQAVQRHGKLSMGAIIEETDGQRIMMDLDTKLLSIGTVMVEGPVTDYMAMKIRREMLYLASKRQQEQDTVPIFMMIDSPGGSVSSMFSIVDSINMAKNTKVKGQNIPVIALVNGHAASAGSIIASAATACYMTENSEFMLHAPLYGTQGGISQHEDAKKHIDKLYQKLLTIYSRKTGYPEKELRDWIYRGERWLDHKQSQRVGLSQGMVESYEALAKISALPVKKSSGKRPDLFEVDGAPFEKVVVPRPKTRKAKAAAPPQTKPPVDPKDK